MQKKLHNILLIITSVLITSCGGGNSTQSDDPNTPVPTPQPAEERYNIRGQVTLNQDIVIDSDLPNKAFSYLDNNTISNAQPVFFPGRIIGYSGRYITNDGEVIDDHIDVFVINLESTGLNLTLFQQDASADIDLFIYKSSNLEDPITSGTNLAQFEQITFTGDGIYYLVIQADPSISGSKYSLALTESQEANYTSSYPENNGEFIFKKKDGVLPNLVSNSERTLTKLFDIDAFTGRVQKSTLRLKEFKESYGVDFLKDDISNEFKISSKTKKEIQQHKILQKLKEELSDFSIELNHIYRKDATQFTPDPFYNEYQWNLRQIKTKEALDLIGQETKDIVVAVLDSGAPSQDSLAWQNSSFVEGGYDFVADEDASFDGDGIDDDPTDPDFQPIQDNGDVIGSHGAHVATTISAKNDGNEINGLAVKTLPLRVCGSDRSESGGGCSSYDQLQAFYYIQGKENDSGELYDSTQYGRVEVINMSLGGGGNNAIICEEIENLKNSGIFVVASAGNEGNSAIRFPASCEYSISVSSTKFDERKSSFSSYNNFVNLAAPGGQLSEDLDNNGRGDGIMAYTFRNSSQGGNDYKGLQQYQGTSMAAPHVSGYLALIKTIDPDITFEELDLLIKSKNLTKDVGYPGKDEFYGYGLIDMAVGIENLINGIPPEQLTFSEISPEKLFLGYALNEKVFSLSGNAEVESWNLEDPTNSLSLEQTSSVDINGYGEWKVKLDRTNLADGNYMGLAIIAFKNDRPSVSLPIFFASGEERVKATVDQLWICARNDENDIIPCDVMQMVEGIANFRIREVPNDTYISVFACTTLTNTLQLNALGLCGEADLRGSYSGNNFTVNGSDVNDIDLTISVNIPQQ